MNSANKIIPAYNVDLAFGHYNYGIAWLLADTCELDQFCPLLDLES